MTSQPKPQPPLTKCIFCDKMLERPCRSGKAAQTCRNTYGEDRE